MNFLKRIAPALGLVIFAMAASILHHQLYQYGAQHILDHVKAIPWTHLGTAVFLTLVSYLLMTGYDLLGLRYLGHPLERGKTMLASFLGYAFSNNVGLSMVAGASVRFRLYSAWGLSPGEIARLVIFCIISLWVGFFTLAGIVFLLDPLPLPQSFHLPLKTVRPLGFFMLLAPLLYLGAVLFCRKKLSFRGWDFSWPSRKVALAQIGAASLDWFLAGTVLYSLLPTHPSLTFGHTLAIFLLAQTAALISQVPGGLGVFESMVLLLAPGDISRPALGGALLVYRGVYYLLPFGTALIMLGFEEILRRQGLFRKLRSTMGSALETLFIPLLSFGVFLTGLFMLFSSALPILSHSTILALPWLSLPFLEVSHFLGSLVGMGLLLLARGIQLRLDAAYLLTLLLLVLGTVTSLLKGFNYGEACMPILMSLGLFPCRRFFSRKASLFSEKFTPGWIAAIGVALGTSLWLGFFAYHHVDYSGQLWWHFSLQGDAPRFLRASVGVFAIALAFSMAHLLRPAPYKTASSSEPIPEAVLSVVSQSPKAEAKLALLGDKRFLLNQEENAFIMYGISGETWVVLGDPIGPVERWHELLWEFREEVNRQGHHIAFYEVGHQHLHMYLDLGLHLFKLGEEARVSLQDFSLEGSERRSLRHTHRKLSKEGCAVTIIPREKIFQHMETLQTISDAWLCHKNTREKRFSLGLFDPQYLSHFPVAMVYHQDRPVAFANLWLGANQEEFSVDLMRYLPEAPKGIMEFLFLDLMLWGAAQGFRWFSMGMAPLSGMENRELAPLWHRMGNAVAHWGDHFYSFEGLRAYKSKFHPLWEPRYLATRGDLSLPRTLMDVSALISGGVKGILGK